MTVPQQVNLLCFVLFPLVTTLQSALLLWWSWPSLRDLVKKQRSMQESTIHTSPVWIALARASRCDPTPVEVDT